MTKSKVLGSTLIIAGTTIGAGMLALPLASAGIGFTTSLIIMVALWALMAYTALLMVELHQHADASATLHTLAKQFLGKKGKWVASFSMLFLFYSLCAAYIAGGGAQFGERISQFTGVEISGMTSTVIFTIVVAAVVTIGTGTVDKVNRVLFAIKLIAMAMVLTFLAPNVTESYLLSMPVEQGLVVAAIPVIFTSFGFHGSIPAIVNYLDGNTPSLRKAIIVGSSIPLMIYVFWQIVTLGVVSQDALVDNQGLSGLISTLSTKVHQSGLGQTIGVFADLALLTSFLGVSLGLFEFLGDSFNKKKAASSRIVVGAITFVPPMGFALFYPQGFIMALGYAAIALAILAIFLPIMMVKKARVAEDTQGGYQVFGGTTGLMISGTVGFVIIAAQLLITMGVLPSLG
ncbi:MULTISPECIES: aromatic amino acid transport family protein [unclassified Vibrio]|uniref:aromatic amino acid transport family protein n=1 Tax=unclassified Vibrio TaxID=2614977 RepID=UPI0012685B77|nr:MULTISPECIES: aromatic amino acid transport family protein [unclassified Vibrio]MCM5509113.1 amino acid permease [Vibrio sp. SCSIO 43169]QFT38203.1 Tyrosine-specific transport protein [Vibrio sp. THAF64]QGM37259.1 Tyrosine-specific transport protein [Vibrio sp. THAF191d]QGN72600.1 Tyrosine-specific transport protein [Vibrio sp. THAF191c]